MPVDPYAPCPGGTGKKIKFCCPDLTSELDKIQRMLEGEQRAGCLDYIESLEQKYPDRACLLSTKAMLQAQLGIRDKAESTLASYMDKYPDNPVALAEAATLKAANEGSQPAVEALQRAIELCGNQIPNQVFEAIGVLAQRLLADGHILAARAHLVMQLAIGGIEQKGPMSMLVQINGAPGIPLLFKEDLPLAPAPEDALWKKSHASAMDLAMRGAWLAGAKQYEQLAASAGDWPQIWRNAATLRCWLGDDTAAVHALRKYAAQNIPLDDAVEAEATAQLLDAEAEAIDVLTITYPVTDFEKVLAAVSSTSQIVRIPVDLARLTNGDEPPPKGAFWLLDRPVPASGVGIARVDVPRVVGQAFLFGKQTDREARVELVAYRTPELDKAKSVLQQVAGDALGQLAGEEVTTHISATQHLLSWNWRLPDDTPAEHRQQLMREQRQAAIMEDWLRYPQKQLGGNSPLDAAAGFTYRTKLLAAVLLLELSPDQAGTEFDYNEVRRELNLPLAEPIDPTATNLEQLPLARLARVAAEKVSTPKLVELYHRADHYRHVRALKKFAVELSGRTDLPSDFDKAAVYGVLAEVESDPALALEYLDKARQTAEAAGQSSAPWDLAELTMRMSRGDIEEADRLLQHLRDEHLREPGVAQALYQLLAEIGAIRPDGTPAAPAGTAGEAPALVVPGGTAEPGKLWTPGSDAPAGKKSTIWTPD